MIELAFVACLAADPTACREQSLLYADLAMLTCLVGAQRELAVWAEAHPEWTVGRWSCRAHDPGRMARKT